MLVLIGTICFQHFLQHVQSLIVSTQKEIPPGKNGLNQLWGDSMSPFGYNPKAAQTRRSKGAIAEKGFEQKILLKYTNICTLSIYQYKLGDRSYLS